MKKWMVEFDFFGTLNGVKAGAIKMGFETEDEAQEWANEYTTDGLVSWYKEA